MEYVEKGISLIRAAGRPGLFLLAFLDSAGIPTGGGPDLMISFLSGSGRNSGGWVGNALFAVAGSVLGCLLFYSIGRWGGKQIRRRFGRIGGMEIRERIERFGPWAIGIAVIAPPPYPMKLFVLSAGFFRMQVLPFLGAVLVGRTLRYGVVSYLAARYGDRAAAVVRGHFPAVFGGAIAVVGIGLLVRWQWKRRRGLLEKEAKNAA